MNYNPENKNRFFRLMLHAILLLAFCVHAFSVSGSEQKIKNIISVMANNVTPDISNSEISSDTQTPLFREIPATANINVEYISQMPELPNGCEATSLAMVLRHFGYDADKISVATEYIKCVEVTRTEFQNYSIHPNEAYIGNPAELNGFYCYAPALCNGANKFLTEKGSRLSAYDITGSTIKDWEQNIAELRPVIIWATLDYGDIAFSANFSWQLPDKSLFTPYSNLHCVVLTGYDEQNFEILDPLSGVLCIPKNQVFASYTVIGSHAIVISAK